MESILCKWPKWSAHPLTYQPFHFCISIEEKMTLMAYYFAALHSIPLCNKVHFDLPLTGIGSGVINYAWQCMDRVLTYLFFFCAKISEEKQKTWLKNIYFKFLLRLVVINRHLPSAQ